MAWRFNAPPGWPVPPDFVPPQGWVPDPAWPPAPAGWTYWVEGPEVPGPWADPYPAAAPVYGAPVGYGARAATKRGLPGWAVALIVVLALGVVTVIALVVAVLIALAPNIDEFITELEQEGAQYSASLACDEAALAFAGNSATPDPIRAGFQVRSLSEAIDDATEAAASDAAYEPLRDDLVQARGAAQQIAALPADASSWTTVQRRNANQAQAALNASAVRISTTCSTITDPWDDADSFGPVV